MVRDEWDFPLCKLMFDHWRDHPPMHLIAAAYVGYEAPAKAKEQNGIEQFMAQFGGGKI